ncbi:MAG TPA: TlpA disulfide reductase family protein [Bacteroidia bacterium]|jgi:thiol-disulfide isomerase/thioredoxin|nr:TlpA disulfide reductase family protein [Bacteroidia bacterium]
MIKKLILLLVISASATAQIHINDGLWRGVLTLDTKKQLELPFIFNVYYADGDPSITIFNAEEKIVVDEIEVKNDSVFFKMPVFDTEFRCKFFPGLLQGVWINHSKKENNVIPFSAIFGQTDRFKARVITRADFAGRWETTFGIGTPDSSKAIGVFKQKMQVVTGTFLSESGDYRYLEGIADGKNLYLSTFDGAHAYLFTGVVDEKGVVNGDFYSGLSGHEKFKAVPNTRFELRDPYSITKTVKGQPVDFSFTNTEGTKVSLSDEKYKNKVVIVQIMGSWCPNCMDETAYLSNIYNDYQSKGVEIIALAYERTTDMEKAKSNVLRLKSKYGAQYEFLITGLSGAVNAQKSLPFLSSVSAFPTTIYLNKKHEVVKIYTGYSGPATGAAYVKMKENTENLLNELIK